ncbi:MAG: TetR/AcrR family transcriptional regulator [Phreatobacter sp.]|uniref:TetR/AcrR family transcriptional regulator n=1 Tax=Phreatobacter sp. TaxID=1966341 RepID=UPI001A4F55EF|nr:TetR/AcrR family transcriptional regulator [Phreatobacter sp.]MBL8571151.1 TetR/AcrR family transcriptional regulator [Phreatobacter sp.]
MARRASEAPPVSGRRNAATAAQNPAGKRSAAGAANDVATTRSPKSADAPKRPPGRPRNSERDRPDQTRDQLLDASITLFARYGFDTVTTGQIAEAAGLTQSMVHYHFGTKTKLWEEAMRRLMRRRGRLFRATPADLAGLDPLGKLKVLTRRLIEANAANPDHVRIVVYEATTRSPRLKWLIDNFLAPGFGVFDQAVREAMDSGAMRRAPVHDITNAVTSAASLSFALHTIVKDMYGVDLGQQRAVASFSDTLIDILFDGLLAAPAQGSASPRQRAPETDTV